MKILNMNQSGPAWKQWRGTGIGGSDACALMGTVKWKTREQLMEQKKHLGYQDVENAAMRRGKALENEAREAYNQFTGSHMKPVCIENETFPWLKASVDGWDSTTKTILEVKCPGDWNHKKTLWKGELPWYYKPQVMHYLLVATEADQVHYWSFTDSQEFPPWKRYLLVTVSREGNEKYLEELFKREAEAVAEIEQHNRMPNSDLLGVLSQSDLFKGLK